MGWIFVIYGNCCKLMFEYGFLSMSVILWVFRDLVVGVGVVRFVSLVFMRLLKDFMVWGVVLLLLVLVVVFIILRVMINCFLFNSEEFNIVEGFLYFWDVYVIGLVVVLLIGDVDFINFVNEEFLEVVDLSLILEDGDI